MRGRNGYKSIISVRLETERENLILKIKRLTSVIAVFDYHGMLFLCDHPGKVNGNLTRSMFLLMDIIPFGGFRSQNPPQKGVFT